MSLFGKILDKLGRRKEGPTVVGTAEVKPPDPLSTASTSAAEATSNAESLPVAMPTGSAPLSIEENNNNKSTMDKE